MMTSTRQALTFRGIDQLLEHRHRPVHQNFLCEEDLFTLLLRRGYFHRSTDVATLKIAENLYSTSHELVHRHESGLLGRTKPTNQLVAYIGKPGNGLEIILDAFVKFAFVRSASSGHRFAMTLVHLVRPMS